MNKTNFIWCLNHTKGKVQLRLRHDGNGRLNVFHFTLICIASIATPRQDKNGKGIAAVSKQSFVVAGVHGGFLSETDRNGKCRERANRLFVKYSRWAVEAIGARFARTAAEAAGGK